jgi:hypothetical protein
MLVVIVFVVQRGLYDYVTVPVLVPIERLPRELPGGIDTFKIQFPRMPMPRRKSEGPPPKPLRWIPRDRAVVVLSSSDLDPKSERGKRIWNAVGSDVRKELLGVIVLRNLIQRGETYSSATVKQVYHDLAFQIFGQEVDRPWSEEMLRLMRQKTGRPDWKPKSEVDSFGEAIDSVRRHPTVVAGLVTRELDPVRLVLWWSGSCFLPAIWCEDLREAIYVLSLPAFAGGKALMVCPRCREVFVQSRPDQDYCSIRCREAYRVARWRAEKRRGQEARSHKKTGAEKMERNRSMRKHSRRKG